MPFKVNIATKDGKSWKFEVEGEYLLGKAVGDKIQGSELKEELQGYELVISGASDIAGFPHKADVEGQNLQRVLLSKGWGMKDSTKGLRKRKTVRGKELSENTVQVNLIIDKEGSKTLKEIFPDQNKEPEPSPEEKAAEEKVAEEIKEEVKEEIKDDIPKSPETNTDEKKDEAAEKVAEEIKEEVEDVAKEIAKEETK